MVEGCLAQHAADLPHDRGGVHVVSGDVAHRDHERSGLAVGGRGGTGQVIGVVPVAADHVVVRGRLVQGADLDVVGEGQVGEHGGLELPGDGDPLVQVQGAFHRLCDVAGRGGEGGPLGDAHLVPFGPADREHAQQSATAPERQAQHRGEAHAVEEANRLGAVVGDHRLAVGNENRPAFPHGPGARERRVHGQRENAPFHRVLDIRVGNPVQFVFVSDQQTDVRGLPDADEQVPHSSSYVLQPGRLGQLLRGPQQELGMIHPGLGLLLQTLRIASGLLGGGPRGLQHLLRGPALRRQDAQTQLGRACRGQILQVGQLARLPGPRFVADGTQRAHDESLGVGQRHSRVRDDPEVRDGRMGAEPFVGAGVRHHQGPPGGHHVPAERMRQRQCAAFRPGLS